MPCSDANLLAKGLAKIRSEFFDAEDCEVGAETCWTGGGLEIGCAGAGCFGEGLVGFAEGVSSTKSLNATMSFSSSTIMHTS